MLLVRQGDKKVRVLDWLTKRRVSWKAVIENSKLALNSMEDSPNSANKI